jgi:hypothetical protein
LVARLELDRGLEHLERRRIGGVSARPALPNTLDLGHGLDQPVGLLEQLRRLRRREPGSAEGM